MNSNSKILTGRPSLHVHVYAPFDIPVNLSDPHGRRSPATENDKAGGLARRLF